MLRKKLKESLTVRIFCVTSLILLAASAATFGFIAWATPITYTTVQTEELALKSEYLVKTLQETDYTDAAPVITAFARDEADVAIVGPDSELADTLSQAAMQASYADGTLRVVTTVPDGTDVAAAAGAEDAVDSAPAYSVTMGTPLTFSFADRPGRYTLYVTPRTQDGIRQALSALGRVAPYLLVVMLLFSVLGALFYSRYITRPIVRLSGISQKMAGLDFSFQYGERRQDEIGVLGRNLNQLSDRLSQALGELRQANEALQLDIDRERELERQRLAFFSAVSHELKTPVTILKGQLSGMLEGVDVYQDRDQYLAKSLRVTARMENLVQEILTVSRMESSGFALHPKPVDLGRLVAALLVQDEGLFAAKPLRLETTLPEGLVVPADPALLKKAVDNLLSNAVFYAPAGAAVSVAVAREAGAVSLSVENSGSHIPEDALPHVFEAFYRAESSRNRRTGGSGLGLYIVQMILDRHGAAYRIENTETGVLFTIRFPVPPALGT
ncbi:sensor histidine kinase [Intestinibacillus massiliensis]|uniref:sensor histidine kinase n=1 Tax=Intestinibacillus massiliensis TaxID=1871029 RepID=UPI000B358114|nr:HAMP domain-containing sensor histidine kinase [Intestinibacillus massiliensis]